MHPRVSTGNKDAPVESVHRRRFVSMIEHVRRVWYVNHILCVSMVNTVINLSREVIARSANMANVVTLAKVCANIFISGWTLVVCGS